MNSFKFAFCVFLYFFGAADTIKKDKEKTEGMVRLSALNGVVDIDESRFKSYVHTKKRNYHVLLLFTVSLPERNCAHCKDATEAFEEAASNWRFSEDFDSSLFFAKTDFDHDGMNVFQAYKVNTAPVVYFLHSDGSQKHSVFMEKYGFTAEGYAEYVQKVTDIKIRIMKLPNYGPFICIAIVLLLFAVAIRYKLLSMEGLLEVIGQTTGVLVIFFILAMTSGFMWNHMRNPMMVYEKENEMLFIHPWTDGQLIAESFIILALNLLIAVGVVMMSEGGKNTQLTCNKKKAFALVGLLVTTGFFFALLSIFRNKYEGYPKTLLFF